MRIKAKHTPAPWTLTRNPHGEVHEYSVSAIVESPDSDAVARDEIANIHLHHKHDAHLIAAAPELLELLQAALPLIADRAGLAVAYKRDDAGKWTSLENHARYAIAKALGDGDDPRDELNEERFSLANEG